jgi:MarR family transcriptional regulator, organic hydroperoxide resistance regulator
MKLKSSSQRTSASEEPGEESLLTKLHGNSPRELWLFELAPRLVRLQDMSLRTMKPSITFVQFRLLQRVAEGRQTLTAISQKSTLSLPTLSERIEGAVKKKLLRRKSDPLDRRASILALTLLGEASIIEAKSRLDRLDEWMLGALSESAYQQFRRFSRDLDDRLIGVLRELEGSKKDLMTYLGKKK